MCASLCHKEQPMRGPPPPPHPRLLDLPFPAAMKDASKASLEIQDLRRVCLAFSQPCRVLSIKLPVITESVGSSIRT